jgi:hypothetical protein
MIRQNIVPKCYVIAKVSLRAAGAFSSGVAISTLALNLDCFRLRLAPAPSRYSSEMTPLVFAKGGYGS